MGKQNSSNGGGKSQYTSAAMKKLIIREQEKRLQKKQKQNIDQSKKKKGKESKGNSNNNNNKSDTNNIFQSDPPIIMKANNNNNNNNNNNKTSNTSEKGNSKLSDLQLKFAKKLEGARFRTINERLYTTKGSESFEEFQKDPRLFDIYHEGFREQASHWPENPLHIIISWIKNKHAKEIIADFGCGEALLAKTLVKTNKVYSFDLVARNEFITACDISHTPLEDNSVNIVVFCLALMGTNIGDFLKEAYRILMKGGRIKIAEIRSRFEGEENGMKKFIRILKRAGFDVVDKDNSNKMFFLIECVKTERVSDIDDNYSAKPCLYKRR